MLAPSQLPPRYQNWNRAHGAPSGFQRPRRELFRRFYPAEAWQRLRGPFGLQSNNRTRVFEYPWAYYAADLSSPRKIVEIGGSLSGFQFVLSRAGHEVVNIDPGMEAAGVGWPSDIEEIGKLNDWFGTSVELRPTTIDKAELPDDYFDYFFSISVLEHLPQSDLQEVMRHARRCLKPGGRFIITLDLFLNLYPFTTRHENEFGTNQDVRHMVEMSGLELVEGDRSKLFGFPEFDAARIQSELEAYFIGNYPVLTQCLTLQRPLT